MQAVTPLYSPAYEVVRHDLHVGFDLATYRETEEWLIAETTVAAEVVVTLGDRHCLYRFGFTWPGDDSLGESTVEQLVVLRVDHDGRFLREDLFAGDRLLDAARCLAERWAEDERPGEASPIVDATLWSFYAALGAAAWDQIADVFTETAVVADRRPVSAGVLEGREAITAWTRAFRDGADAMHATVDDVLAIAVSAILVRQVVTGRASGAPFEANAVVLAVFADDGRVAFAENWSLDQLDEAWASWDRLAGVPRENRAVAVLRRWAAALLRGDRDEAAKTFAPDILAEDRRALVGSPTGDLVEARRQLDALADGGPFDLVVEPVETRGDDLGLCRIVFTTANDALVDTLTMVEVSDGGLMRRSVTFDGDDLESALAELDLVAERSTASTGDNAAVALVRRWAAAMSHRDVEGAMAMSAPDIVVEDRRPVVGIAHTGVEAARRVLASIIATGVVRVDVQLIEERGDTVALVRVVYGDEVAEVAVLMVATTVPDGTLVARFVTFEADDLDGARAELARLADRVAPENDAVRAVRRWVAAIAAGDVDLASAATTTWGVTDDRRPVVGGGRMRSHLTRTENEAIIVAGANEVIVEPLAARGDHLALLRMQFRSSGDDVVEVLSLTRLDPLSGRIAGSVVFAPDDVDAAGAELDRLADLEHNLALILLRRVAAAMSAGDVEAALALHTADVDHVDHRPLVGSDGGGHAWLRRLLDVIAGRGGVDVIVTPLSGPDDRTVLARSHFRIQGDAEVETLQVLRADEEGERLIAVHTFDPDDVDGATALLHRLVDGPS